MTCVSNLLSISYWILDSSGLSLELHFQYNSFSVSLLHFLDIWPAVCMWNCIYSLFPNMLSLYCPQGVQCWIIFPPFCRFFSLFLAFNFSTKKNDFSFQLKLIHWVGLCWLVGYMLKSEAVTHQHLREMTKSIFYTKSFFNAYSISH